MVLAVQLRHQYQGRLQAIRCIAPEELASCFTAASLPHRTSRSSGNVDADDGCLLAAELASGVPLVCTSARRPARLRACLESVNVSS